MTGVQRQAADLLQRLNKMSFSLAKKKGQHLDIGEFEIIQMAVDKQVPNMPIMESDGYCPDGYPAWDYYCPRCNYNFEDNEPDYCPNCGQAIDWRGI